MATTITSICRFRLCLLSIVVISIAAAVILHRMAQQDVLHQLKDYQMPVGLYGETLNRSSTSNYMKNTSKVARRNEDFRIATDTAYSEYQAADCPWGQQSLPRAPSLVIAGAAKSGTTPLYFFLRSHPDIQPCTCPHEAHFFDRKQASRIDVANYTHSQLCHARRTYSSMFDVLRLSKQPHLISVDKTPRYLAMVKVPARLKLIAPWAKVIILLRNPIDRAFSHYEMSKGTSANYPSFEEEIERQRMELRSKNCTYAPTLQEYLENAGRGNFSIPSTFEIAALSQNLLGLLSRGQYAIQLRNWLTHYQIDENLMVIQYEEFLNNKQTILNRIYDFVGVAHVDVAPEILASGYSPRRTIETDKSNNTLSEDARKYLAAFYKPHNDALADLLGPRWRGVWEP